jgi:hypothetical protein
MDQYNQPVKQKPKRPIVVNSVKTDESKNDYKYAILQEQIAQQSRQIRRLEDALEQLRVMFINRIK